MVDWVKTAMDIGSTAKDVGSTAVDIAKVGFTEASKYAGNAFDWMEKYPESANVIGGVAMGVGQAYTASKQREAEREMQRERLEAQKIAPSGASGGYGGYRDSISDGLISNGLIASQRDTEGGK